VATLLRAGGGSRAAMLGVNAAFALLVPIGAVLFIQLGPGMLGGADVAVPYALAFSAGTFLCIAAADLLPEVQFHRHDRIGLSVALILGLGLALAVGKLEASSHSHAGHDHAAESDGDHAGHDHAGHDHAPGDGHSH
jgi:zinc and cadmium transporter